MLTVYLLYFVLQHNRRVHLRLPQSARGRDEPAKGAVRPHDRRGRGRNAHAHVRGIHGGGAAARAAAVYYDVSQA